MNRLFFSNPSLVISLLIATATASTEVPLWITGFSFVIFIWKFFSEKKSVSKIPVKWTPVLGLMIFVLVYLQYHNIFGVEESSIILIGLMSLIVLNYKTNRDHQFLVLLGFIIMMIKVTFTVDLIWMAPTLFVFFSLWHSLISSQQIAKNKFLFWTAVKSAPVMLILFILFPRLILFQTTRVPRQALVQTAYSEDLKPGQFTDVAQWDQLAFRAEFVEHNKIPLSQLYWRGTVLNFSKGFEWSRGPSIRKRSTAAKSVTNGIKYRIIQEPSSNQKAVFVLDPTSRINSASELVEEWPQGTFRLDRISVKQLQFEAETETKTMTTIENQSETADETGERVRSFGLADEDPTNQAVHLQVPSLSPRTQAWVNSNKEKYLSVEQRLEALIEFFSDTNFVYTLNPGYYRKNDLDDFLFVRKKGFCEHYAAAFASMARALEIPSRIVIGYQGGAFNFRGGFWKIAQKDSHVWTELAINKKWVRYDPTKWISPLRISLGAENFFSLSKEDQINFSHNPNWQKPADFFTVVNDISAFFENVNYSWTVFVLDFDKETQLNFLKRFKGAWMLPGFAVMIFILLIYYLNHFRLRKKKNLYPFTELFQQIESRAYATGIEINLSTPPLTVLEKIKAASDDKNSLVSEFQKEYEDVIYRGLKQKKSTSKWHKEWKQFFKNKKLKS